MAFNHIEPIPHDRKVRVIRYLCPYCKGEAITKVENPKSCSICTRRFSGKKFKILRDAWL